MNNKNRRGRSLLLLPSFDARPVRIFEHPWLGVALGLAVRHQGHGVHLVRKRSKDDFLL
jgi:hypothetical protein